MRARDHKKILQLVLDRFNFTLIFREGLLEGVVEPDKKKDRRYGKFVSHHNPPPTLVEYYFCLSLYYYQKNYLHLAGRSLGRAIHYVQDRALHTYGGTEHHEDLEGSLKALLSNNRVKKLLGKLIDKISGKVQHDFTSSVIRTIDKIHGTGEDPYTSIVMATVSTYIVLEKFYYESTHISKLHKEISRFIENLEKLKPSLLERIFVPSSMSIFREYLAKNIPMLFKTYFLSPRYRYKVRDYVLGLLDGFSLVLYPEELF